MVNTRAVSGIGLQLIEASRSTLEQEVRQLCALYGKKEVEVALKKAQPSRRGRPPEPDGPALWRVALADARDWLEGRDPFQIRKTYSIAVAEANRVPGHSPDATKRRFERKLGKRRRAWMLLAAEYISRTEYPAIKNAEALEALGRFHKSESYLSCAADVRSLIDDFQILTFTATGLETLKQIEDAMALRKDSFLDRLTKVRTR